MAVNVSPLDMKKCGYCGVRKPTTHEYFYANSGRSTGLDSTCKVCAKNRAYQWYRDNKERGKASRQHWHETNRKRANARNAKRRIEYPEKVKAEIKDWITKNPEKFYAIQRNYRNRKLGASGMHTGDDIKQLFVEQRGLCAGCKILLVKYEVDHIMPLSLGGSNDKANLQLLCKPCNLSKGHKHPTIWNARIMKEQCHGS